MHIGDILVRKNLATREQIDAALERQKLSNAPLGKVLVNMGVLSEEALAQILNAPPEAPKTLAETGIVMGELRNLMLKTMNLLELQVPSEIADAMKLSAPMVRELLEDKGIDVIETPIGRDELYSADEAFLTGTAAEVTPIREVDGKGCGNAAVQVVIQSRVAVSASPGIGPGTTSPPMTI